MLLEAKHSVYSTVPCHLAFVGVAYSVLGFCDAISGVKERFVMIKLLKNQKSSGFLDADLGAPRDARLT